PDPKTLSAIARITGGEFFRARDAHALQDAYNTLGSKLARTRGTREVTDLFAFGAALLLVAGAAFLLVLAGVLSAFWSPRLP
ncbi:MAG TPA: hypothetical protein VI814_11370, partial [Candidatus Limnocylindria bacterium]